MMKLSKLKYISIAMLILIIIGLFLPDEVNASSSDIIIKGGVLTDYFGEGGNITIPNTVISIGSNAFSVTPWLEEQRKENPMVVVNGILSMELHARER